MINRHFESLQMFGLGAFVTVLFAVLSIWPPLVVSPVMFVPVHISVIVALGVITIVPSAGPRLQRLSRGAAFLLLGNLIAAFIAFIIFGIA